MQVLQVFKLVSECIAHLGTTGH